MRRWLKYEVLDLEAILEAIQKKNEMEKRRIAKDQTKEEYKEELRKLREGKETILSFFRTKQGKVDRITELTNYITQLDKDIECLSVLHKIIVLQLNQAAIQFFKREKFSTYNHTVNMYANKVLNNQKTKLDLFMRLSQVNQKTQKTNLDRSIMEA